MDQPSPPPAARLIELLSGSFIAQAISVAATLGIADRLSRSPATAAVLAQDLQVDESALLRVMRLLVAHGVFRREATGAFALTGVPVPDLNCGVVLMGDDPAAA